MIKSGTSKKTFTNLTCFTILASSEIILEISLKKSDEAKIKWQNKFINVLFFIIKYFTIIKFLCQSRNNCTHFERNEIEDMNKMLRFYMIFNIQLYPPPPKLE